MNESMNYRMIKAGCKANIIRGRVGRGGNARLRTFELDQYQRTDGRTNKASHTVASPRLKLITICII